MQVHPVARCRFSPALLLPLVPLISDPPVHAQAPLGTWSTGFDHSTVGLGGALNDYLSPFQGQPGYVPPPFDPYSLLGSWGFYVGSRGYQSVHMALIPKGPHQGKVLIWDEWPVLLKPGTTLDPPQNRWWVFQTWSIVDPVNRQFRNYLLPLRPTGDPALGPIPVESLVCSGHAWSQHGDLVVAGGSMADVVQSPFSFSNVAAAKFLWMFDPARASQPFPGQLATSSLYPNEVGHWQKLLTDELLVGRWYPTVTLSQILTRNGLNNEVVMVSGGTDLVSPPASDPALNSYESFVVQASGANPFLFRDPDHSTNPLTPTIPNVLPGPPAAIDPSDERLDLYPRLHLLSDGKMFLSGYAPLSSKIDLGIPLLVPPGPRTWDQTVGHAFTAAWPRLRYDGASVFFARVGVLQDVVIRLGGADSASPAAGVTHTVEYCLATTPNAGWNPLPSIPGPGGQPLERQDLNAVILPDSSVLVIGGTDATGAPVYPTALYRHGIGWQSTPPSPARRMYHSTAVLLPDGSVLVGGGDGRQPGDWDFHVFSPHYLQGSPTRPAIVDITDPTTGLPVPVHPDGARRLTGNTSGFTLECDLGALDSLDKIVLMAPGSITHHSDMTARYVELVSAPVPEYSNKRQFATPGSETLPRGYYMMFALNSGSIPSVAAWVKIL